MKTRQPATLSKRTRQAIEKQVQEYVDNYYLHWGEVSVKVNPAGTIAAARTKAKPRPNA